MHLTINKCVMGWASQITNGRCSMANWVWECLESFPDSSRELGQTKSDTQLPVAICLL